MGRRSQSHGGQAARISHLQQALESHDEDIAKKMALVLHEFHVKYVAPIEARVWYLEQPFYRRWRIRARRLLVRLRVWWSSRGQAHQEGAGEG